MTSASNNQSFLTDAPFPGSPSVCRLADARRRAPGLTRVFDTLRRCGSSPVNLTLFLCGMLALPAPAPAKDKEKDKGDKGLKNAVVLVIRHGEKPDKGQELSKAGKERAQAYVKYFENYTVDSQPFKPDYLFAAADSKDSQRPRLTLEPFSQAVGLKIDARFECTKNQELADAIKKKPAGKQYLICWHHTEIPHLLSALRADPGSVQDDQRKDWQAVRYSFDRQ